MEDLFNLAIEEVSTPKITPDQLVDVLDGNLIDWFPTGSHYICNPPVTDTDIDIMLYVKDLDQSFNLMINAGALCPNDGLYFEEIFKSFRSGKFNYLITDNILYFGDFKLATETAKKLNLLKKDDRISLFEAIVHREFPKK